MSKQFQALHDNLFVKEKKQEIKVGCLVIPDSVDVDYTFGTVVSVGEGMYVNGNYIPTTVKVGDEICFPKTMGTKITFAGNNEELILVRESAVTAVLKDVNE